MAELFLTFVRRVVLTVRAVSAALLLSSVALNFANIVGRYFFSAPIPWAAEVMLFLMVGAVFFGNCAVGWEGRQIRMDVLVGMLPAGARRWIEHLWDLAFLAIGIALVVFAIPVIRQLAAFDQRSQAADIPLAIPQAVIPVGLTIMAFLVAVRLILRLAAERRDRSAAKNGGRRPGRASGIG